MNFNIEDLSLEEKIGQMLMVGIEGKKITQRIVNQIQKYKVGGIILYKRNYDSYDEMVKIIKELKELNKNNKIPLFIAVDQEGGRVNRIPKDILNLPASNKIAKKMGEEGIRKSSFIITEILRKSGFNLNFAPNLDLNRYSTSKRVVGDRSFDENAEIVTKYGIIQMKIFRENGIIPVIKHFPGHGATKMDSHFITPKIRLNKEILINNDIKPFKEAIKEDADCILVAHLRVKNETNIIPCSLSREFILKHLRKKLKFKGVIISDDLKMRSIQNIFGYENAAIRAIRAGNDIILFRYNENKELKTINKIIKYAKNNKLNNYKINQSVKRILKLKQKYNISDETQDEILDIDKINSQIKKIRDIVL